MQLGVPGEFRQDVALDPLVVADIHHLGHGFPPRFRSPKTRPPKLPDTGDGGSPDPGEPPSGRRSGG
ncbi:hypothetical protein NKG94_42760 [Micromonospora sp. M12]